MKNALTPNIIKSLAGEILFSRGVDYFIGGCVTAIMEEEEAICAKVQGKQLYRTKLHLGKDELDFECSCTLGKDGTFCKHLVATGLAWIHQKKDSGGKRLSSAAQVKAEDIRSFLLGKDKEALVAMLVEQAAHHSDLWIRLATEVVLHPKQEP